ncbi:MAG: T9SS type A sorting domain-containing protein [Chitinophagales bacterium]
MKNIITISALLMIGLSISKQTNAQATYWEHTFGTNVPVDPQPVTTTDASGNVISAFIMGSNIFPSNSYIQIEKFSATGEFLSIATIENVSYSGRIRLKTDRFNNIYVLTTLNLPHEGVISAAYLIKYHPDLTISWDRFSYSDGLTGDFAIDLLVDERKGSPIIYFAAYLGNPDGEYHPALFVQRLNSAGTPIDQAYSENALEFSSFGFASGKFVKAINRDLVLVFLAGAIPDETIHIMRFNEGTAAYTTNLSDGEEFLLTGGDYPTIMSQLEVDQNGVLYILGAELESDFDLPSSEEGYTLYAISPEDGTLWTSDAYTETSETSNWPERIWTMKLDTRHRLSLYVAGMIGDFEEEQLKITAVDRTSGSAFSSNIADTTIWMDFLPYYYFHSSDDIIVTDYLGFTSSYFLEGRPLEIIVAEDNLYMNTFGWYDFLFLDDAHAENIIYSLSKDLASCDVVNAISIQPGPFDPIISYDFDFDDFHPYFNNSDLHYSSTTDQLSCIYTNKYLYYELDEFGDTEAKVGNDIILRNYTSGYRVGEENEMPASLSEVSIYPNPATDLIQVHVNDEIQYTLKIQDFTGKQILSQPFVKEDQIPVSQLPRGVYLASIYSGDEIIFTQKIALQ